jgi:hypothetical protein
VQWDGWWNPEKFFLGRLLEFKKADSKTDWQAVVHWYGDFESGQKECTNEESWYTNKYKLLFRQPPGTEGRGKPDVDLVDINRLVLEIGINSDGLVERKVEHGDNPHNHPGAQLHYFHERVRRRRGSNNSDRTSKMSISERANENDMQPPCPWFRVGYDVIVEWDGWWNRHNFFLGRLLEFKKADSKTGWQAVVHWYGDFESGQKRCNVDEDWFTNKYKLLLRQPPGTEGKEIPDVGLVDINSLVLEILINSDGLVERTNPPSGNPRTRHPGMQQHYFDSRVTYRTSSSNSGGTMHQGILRQITYKLHISCAYSTETLANWFRKEWTYEYILR